MDFTSLLNTIEANIKKMKLHNVRLEKENEELRKSVFEYLEKLETQKKAVNTVNTELQAKQTANATTLDHKQLQKELDNYIRMIDKCIASIKV